MATFALATASAAHAALPQLLPTPTPTRAPSATPSATATPAPPPPSLLEPTPGTSGAPAFARTISPLVTAARSSGSWQVLPYSAPGLAVHATVLNDGRVLLAEGSGNNPTQFAAGTFNVWTWDPTAGTFSLVPQLPTDLFCGGHAVLANGKVLFLGGTSAYRTSTRGYLGTRASYEFDPTTNTFTREPDMANARWYPSALERGDGDVLAVSGADDTTGTTVKTPELFDAATSSWSSLPSPTLFPLYPAITLLGDGQVFYAGVGSAASTVHAPGVWNPLTNHFTTAPALQNAGKRNQAATVLLPPAQDQRFAVFGGGPATVNDDNAVASVDLYNLSTPSAPTHSVGALMASPKMHVLGVILPDETVLETGGSLKFAQQPVAEAAIYHPTSNTWTQMNPATVPRTYHSEAILLPDGRVATLGSNSSNYKPETRIEVFSPPYLFNGQRPVIAAAPDQVGYGARAAVNVQLAPGASLSKVVLIKPASVTHSVDPNQRLVETTVTDLGSGNYGAAIPTNPNLLPPGWYMMFAVDNSGRPSVAHWVHVG